jgi:catechol 2,3-dioxygenase-like lactoylglutathione lyase family enzyme
LQVRFARQTPRLDEVVAFYRDRLGLPEIGRFTGHAGYDGVMLGLPGTSAHLEFTAAAHLEPPAPHPETLVVLYLGSMAAVSELVRSGSLPTVASVNPYWDSVGVTVVDPDGCRVVLVGSSWGA